MKVTYAKILMLTIASVGLSAGLLYAAKPSLSAAKNATTVGDLLAVIRTASTDKGKGTFFVWNAKQKKYTSPSKIGINEDATFLTAPVGALTPDAPQINTIKTALHKTAAYKRLNKEYKNKVNAWVDAYTNYLLYFVYNGNKFYINDPWPQLTINEKKAYPTAIYNIIQKWVQ